MKEPDAKPVVAYASDVALGSGRTPVGIVLTAGGHLLLGAAAACCLLIALPHLLALRRSVPANVAFFLVLSIVAVSALAGGCALLAKGRLAWTICVVSFALLGVGEALGCAFAVGMIVRFSGRDPVGVGLGFFFAGIITSLMVMSMIVLRYVTRSKARVTFALPPGEVPQVAGWLPAVIGFLYIVCIVGGAMVARLPFWTDR